MLQARFGKYDLKGDWMREIALPLDGKSKNSNNDSRGTVNDKEQADMCDWRVSAGRH